MAEPIAGATAVSFTTPALEATTHYWVRVSNGLGSADSSDAVVMVAVPDAFLDWRTGCFGAEELANPAISGPDADPDGDGFSNTDEYVLGPLL